MILRTAVWMPLAALPVIGDSVFTDVTAAAGITFRHQASWTSQKYLIETMGAGAAWLDYDGDGYLDLFFVNGAALADPMPKDAAPDKSAPRFWNRLYRNRGNGAFEDVTARAGLRGRGYGMGVAAADYDNDGHPDLYVTGYGANQLYRNRGDGTFQDVTEAAGVAAGGWSAGAAFLDYDRDGYLDLFAARYLDWSFENNPWCGPEKADRRGYCHPNAFQPVHHLLYRNLGDGSFKDVSREVGIAAHAGKGLGVAVHDSDGDGWLDILVANDSVAQQLFHNRGGSFSEMALETGLAYNQDGRAFAGMGAAFDDFDDDGRPDVFVNALSREGYVLFRNLGVGFRDVSPQTALKRLTLPYGGWGASFLDFDHDGWKDLFVAQSHVMDTISLDFPQISYRQPLLLLRNNQGRFEDFSSRAGPAFRNPRAARGAAFADYDNDGDLDVAVVENDGPALLLRNTAGTGNWLLIDTRGVRSSRDAIGAVIRITLPSGKRQWGIVSTAGSYLSAGDRRVHFGLGAAAVVKEIEIRWPRGAVQRLENVKANQILKVTEPAGR